MKTKSSFFFVKKEKKEKIIVEIHSIAIVYCYLCEYENPTHNKSKAEKKTLMKKENNNCYGNHMRIGVRKKNVQ